MTQGSFSLVKFWGLLLSGFSTVGSKFVSDCVSGLGRLLKRGYAGFILVRASGE
jgi:hypothetical protein